MNMKKLFIYMGVVLCCQTVHAVYSMISPKAEFISPRNIGFGAVGGGSSHYFWVLEILKELRSRGHNTTLYSRGDSIKLASDYPQIETKTIGGDLNLLATGGKEDLKQLRYYLQHRGTDTLHFHSLVVPGQLSNYTEEYKEYMNLIQKDKMDMMICDMFAVACIDAADSSRLPLVITSTLTYSPDSLTNYVTKQFPCIDEPTTETMTIWQRLQYTFYTFYIPYKIRQFDIPAHTFQKQHGIPLTDHFYITHHRAIKLVNNMFGLEPARPLGPLVQFVGPIMRQEYHDLTPILATFMDRHSRVAYVAFGQHAVPTDHDTSFLVKALMYNLDQGHIDAVVWATAKTHPVPCFTSMTTTDNIFIIDWAPQFALLSHPSMALFITHGGAGSVHEALFNKVPLFVFPFFGDQPSTARMIRRSQLGDFFDTKDMQYTDTTLQELTRGIRYVATDPMVRRSVQHFGAAVQVRSQRAVQRGADTVEELIVGAIDGEAPYMMDVGNHLWWLKRHDLDLLAIVLIGCAGIGWVGIKAIQSIKFRRKIKLL